MLPTPPPVSAGQWSVLTMLNSVPAVAVVWLATLVAAVALAAGASPRIAAIVLLIGIIAFTRRDPYVLNSGDILLRVLAVYLIFAPSGESLSWDRWRRDRERFWDFPRRAPWALRMLQVQLSVIYLAAVWAKLQGDVWRDGTAITYALRMSDQLRFPTPEFVAGSPLLVEWLTIATLLTEVSIGLFVWNRRARPWVLGAGFLMHLGIEIFIMVGFFSIGMWCLYLVFLPPARHGTNGSGAPRPLARKRRVQDRRAAHARLERVTGHSSIRSRLHPDVAHDGDPVQPRTGLPRGLRTRSGTGCCGRTRRSTLLASADLAQRLVRSRA